MDSSETQERTIILGKQLVASMGKDHDVQPLARWMAHYIAEQMVLAESCTGAESEAAKQRCFDTILKLWEHRASMPRGLRPFENFEPIFETLDRLNPSEPRFFWARTVWHSEKDTKDPVSELMRCIESADQAGRIFIEELLSTAVEECTDQETLAYLRAAQSDDSLDVKAIRRLIEDYASDSESKTDRGIVKLHARLETLDRFVAMSHSARELIARRLESRSSMRESRD